jgi:polysaccharide export outer membrane protein
MKAVIAATFVLFLSGAASSSAQQAPPANVPPDTLRDFNQRLVEYAQTKGTGSSLNREDYRIGPEDLIEISVFEVPELSRTVRVSASGEISLPLLGTVKVAGFSPMQLEQVLRELLRRTYIKDPQVSVFMREYKSDPVSVVGAVKMPGLYQIQTRKNLLEVLAMAQGFSEGGRPPGRTIIITRKYRAGETPGSSSGQASSGPPGDSAKEAAPPEIVEVPIKQLLQTGDPKWNVPVYPGDVVKVVLAGTVYVAGSVTRPGAFPLTDFDNISTVQALAMAGGTTKSASRKNAAIVRRDAQGNRVEQKVNLARVLKGQDPDMMMGPNDILFVPGSAGKESVLRGIEAAIQAATLMAYRLP